MRNGYPYGFSSADVDLSALWVSWGSDWRRDELRAEATIAVTKKLIPEIDKLMAGVVANAKARSARHVARLPLR